MGYKIYACCRWVYDYDLQWLNSFRNKKVNWKLKNSFLAKKLLQRVSFNGQLRIIEVQLESSIFNSSISLNLILFAIFGLEIKLKSLN